MNRQIFTLMAVMLCFLCITACGPNVKEETATQSSPQPKEENPIEQNQPDTDQDSVVVQESVSQDMDETEDTVENAVESLDETFGNSALFELAKADEAMTAGTELLQEGEYAKALEQFKIAAKVDTENEEVFFNLAFTQSRLGNDEEAIAAYRKTIDIFPDYGEAHNNLGNIFLKQKLFSKAIDHFETAIEIDPDHAAAHNNLGTALSRQRKINEAVPHFAKATQIDDRYIQAWCNLGNAYTAQNRFEDAIEAFRHALSIDPSFRPALSGMQRIRAKVSTPRR